MLPEVTCVDQRDLRFATAKRILVEVMRLLNVRPRLGKFHKPHVSDGKWIWMLVTRSNDPQRKVPIYFSVDQKTTDTHLAVTHRKNDKLWTYKLPLPLDLKRVDADEIFKQLGFFEEYGDVEVQQEVEPEASGNR